ARCAAPACPAALAPRGAHAAAAPPSSATNFRRPMPDMGGPSLRDSRIFSLPPTPWQVLGASLKCSESTQLKGLSGAGRHPARKADCRLVALPALALAAENCEGRCGRQLRRRATVLGLGSGRPDHLAGLVDAVFGHSVMEDRAETEIPPRLDSRCPGRS